RKARQIRGVGLLGERRRRQRKNLPEQEQPPRQGQQRRRLAAGQEIPRRHPEADPPAHPHPRQPEAGPNLRHHLHRPARGAHRVQHQPPPHRRDRGQLRPGRDQLSHDSSCGARPVPPTMRRKISSSVSVSPAGAAASPSPPAATPAATPCRSSSSDPCATKRPRWMMATWLHSRSTISSTCEVRKIVAPRAIMFCSIAFSVTAATASTPSNGSSRNSTFGPWITAAASASFFCIPWL